MSKSIFYGSQKLVIAVVSFSPKRTGTKDRQFASFYSDLSISELHQFRIFRKAVLCHVCLLRKPRKTNGIFEPTLIVMQIKNAVI